MKCPNCNGEVPEGKRFCGHCGQRLVPIEPRPMTADFDDDAPTMLADELEEVPKEPETPEQEMRICPACGAQNRHDARYCDKCGTSINKVEAAQDLQARLIDQKERIKNVSLAGPNDANARLDPVLQIWNLRPAWQPVVLIGIGIAMITAINIYLFNPLYGVLNVGYDTGMFSRDVIGGILSGLIVGVILRWINQAISWKNITVIAVGWGIAGLIGYILYNVYLTTSIGNYYVHMIVEGAIGGLIISEVLRRKQPPIGRQPAIIIAIGWAMVTAGPSYLFYSVPGVMEVLFDSVGQNSSIFFIEGVFGAIGGWVMFWQLKRGYQQ